MSKTVTYHVTPVTRYVVTRAYSEDHGDGLSSGGVETFGEFDNERSAKTVLNSLRAADPDCVEPQEPVRPTLEGAQ